MHVRRKLVAGNWKMNGSLAQLGEVGEIAAAAREAPGVDVALCPPFTLIAPAVARGGGLPIGGQDCHASDSGAHTGSVSAAMIKEAGGRLVIVGHSERRAEQQESDEIVRAKAVTALRHGLTAIVCVGESEAERDSGRTLAVVESQVKGSLPDGTTAANTVVAYEPVWAIGSGRTPTPEQIREVHGHIRRTLGACLGDGAAAAMRLLYGGSVKPSNAAEILAIADVDGALVGGASLKLDDFWGIAASCP